MSSLSNLPYGKIIDYWYEKLINKPYRFKFLITKTLEVFKLKRQSGRHKNEIQYKEFPQPINNNFLDCLKVIVVIPTFIRTEKDIQDISNLLVSIDKQTFKPSRTIIVDDCSPIDFTFPSNIAVNRLQQNSGPAAARNIGKQKAIEDGANIIAFTDTDCILSENWVETITKSFIENTNFHIISGNTVSFDNHWLGTYHDINGTLNGRKLKNTDRLLYGTTANLAITKEVANNVDFNESFLIAAGEDIDFCFKANTYGYAIKHIPTMTVYHNFGYNGNYWKSLKRFRQLFKKYGQGERILLKEIPEYYAYFDMTEEIPTNNNKL